MTARKLIAAAVATFALSAGVAHAAETPTVVIVHGAFADGSDWST